MHTVLAFHPLNTGTNDKLCCIDSIFCVVQRSWEEVCGDSKVLNVKITFVFHSVLAMQEGGHKYADSASRSQ